MSLGGGGQVGCTSHRAQEALAAPSAPCFSGPGSGAGEGLGLTDQHNCIPLCRHMLPRAVNGFIPQLSISSPVPWVQSLFSPKPKLSLATWQPSPCGTPLLHTHLALFLFHRISISCGLAAVLCWGAPPCCCTRGHGFP